MHLCFFPKFNLGSAVKQNITAFKRRLVYKKQDGKIQLLVIYSFDAVLWDFFNAHPFLAQKGYSLVHFILTPRLFDKRRYSNAQLDTALVTSTALSQLTPAVTNPKS